MPQMAPLMWELIMLSSLLVIMIISNKIYFSIKMHEQNSSKSLTAKTKKDLNWTW